MEKNLFIDFKPQDETCDSISTSAASYVQVPFEEADTSPSNGNCSSSPDNDVQEKSKKIRKKRNAYQKIDDDIRLGLLEAVQRGETLKSAAKRYQVNYSSAKSIFHIFRKEGRILKKITQEKPVNFDFPVGQEIELPPQYLSNCNTTSMEPVYQRAQAQERNFSPMNAVIGCSSPLNGLVDNFSDLLKLENNMKAPEEAMRAKAYVPANPSRFNPKAGSIDYTIPKMQANQAVCFAAKTGANPALLSPAERINRPLDNLYMNYSNSPLSGNAKMMMRDGSGSGSNRRRPGEYESFTDMFTAIQNQNLLAASLKEPTIPKLLMPGMGSAEKKGVFEEEIAWGGALENAARDTYKSFLDAQMVLNNAFRKASLLNNLVHIHKTGSPRFLSFQGN